MQILAEFTIQQNLHKNFIITEIKFIMIFKFYTMRGFQKYIGLNIQIAYIKNPSINMF